MADNVAITAGSGTSIAADDVSSVFYQKVKLDVGGDGATLPVSATANAIPVKAMLQKMWQAYQNEPKLFDASQIRAKLERLETLLKKMVV